MGFGLSVIVFSSVSHNFVPSQYLQNTSIEFHKILKTRPHSAVRNVSGYKCMSDCRSRGLSSILARSILSWRLMMKKFLGSFSSLLPNHSRRVVVSYKLKYVQEILVNGFFKLDQEKVLVN